jgi:hypothetical protein
MCTLEIKNTLNSGLTLTERVDQINWDQMARDLAEDGSAASHSAC